MEFFFIVKMKCQSHCNILFVLIRIFCNTCLVVAIRASLEGTADFAGRCLFSDLFAQGVFLSSACAKCSVPNSDHSNFCQIGIQTSFGKKILFLLRSINP